MKRYRVVADLQGGEFGMGRDYTAEEWLKQAVEWRDSDDSWGDYGEGTDMYGETHNDDREWFIKFWKQRIEDGKEQELIDYIADIWQLEFKEVKENNMRTHNITTLADEVYDKLANNTSNDMFDPTEYGLENMEVDRTRGVITIEYQDKAFELVIKEK